jgi:hypothetical protein
MRTMGQPGTMMGLGRAGLVLAAVFLGLAGIVMAQAPAEAHDHRIPATVLKKGAKELQAGTRVFESSWNAPAVGGGCVTQSAIYRTRFPEADSVPAGSGLSLRVSKAQRPDSFELAAYKALDENGEPAGEGRLLNRTLERVVKGGRTVAWDAVFSVKNPGRDYYLVGEGHWRDSEGCRGDQFAFWSFHVQTPA